MSTPQWIVIPNWHDFQHYKDRTPKWIKTYVELMSDDAYLGLSGHQRAVLHGIWLEYASSRCRLAVDTGSLTRRLSLRVSSQTLEALNHAGFIEFSASAPLAEPEHPASPEVEKRRTPPPPSASRKNGTSPRQRGTNPRAEPAPEFACGINGCPGVYPTKAKLEQHRELAHIDAKPDWV